VEILIYYLNHYLTFALFFVIFALGIYLSKKYGILIGLMTFIVLSSLVDYFYYLKIDKIKIYAPNLLQVNKTYKITQSFLRITDDYSAIYKDVTYICEIKNYTKKKNGFYIIYNYTADCNKTVNYSNYYKSEIELK